ncbi:MAG: YlbF family regulator [Bacillota bacterium]
MNNELINYIDNVIKEIEQHNAYQALLIKQRALDNNKEVMALIEAFKETETAYNEVKKYGQHHPDLKTVRRAFQQAKQTLFEHEDVRTYKTLEKTIQSILDDIVIQIQETISPRVGVKTESRVNIKGGLSCKNG